MSSTELKKKKESTEKLQRHGGCSTRNSSCHLPTSPGHRTPKTRGQTQAEVPQGGWQWACPLQRWVSSPDARSSPHHTFNQEKPVVGESRSLQPGGPLLGLGARRIHVCKEASAPGPATSGPGWKRQRAGEKGSAPSPCTTGISVPKHSLPRPPPEGSCGAAAGSQPAPGRCPPRRAPGEDGEPTPRRRRCP